MPTTQRTLPGIPPPHPLPRSIKARVHMILENYPDSRADYKLVQLYYWRDYQHLDSHLADIEEFGRWYLSAVSAKTLLQRAQDIQRDYPHLAPPPHIAEKRARQGRQGPVGAQHWRAK